MEPANPRQIRVFCDSEVLIAGAASTTGASHVLLRLSELRAYTDLRWALPTLRLKAQEAFLLRAIAVEDVLESLLAHRYRATIWGKYEIREHERLRFSLRCGEGGLTIAKEPRGHIDQGLDFVRPVLRCLSGDHRAAHTMAHQDHGFPLRIEELTDTVNVHLEGYG